MPAGVRISAGLLTSSSYDHHGFDPSHRKQPHPSSHEHIFSFSFLEIQLCLVSCHTLWVSCVIMAARDGDGRAPPQRAAAAADSEADVEVTKVIYTLEDSGTGWRRAIWTSLRGADTEVLRYDRPATISSQGSAASLVIPVFSLRDVFEGS